MYEGFVSAYQLRELSFDETYYDACIADVLRGLANTGIQICITTHDFLLARRLSVSATLPDSPSTRFFNLYRASAGQAVAVEHADTLSVCEAL
jgi:hypothetical protein